MWSWGESRRGVVLKDQRKPSTDDVSHQVYDHDAAVGALFGSLRNAGNWALEGKLETRLLVASAVFLFSPPDLLDNERGEHGVAPSSTTANPVSALANAHHRWCAPPLCKIAMRMPGSRMLPLLPLATSRGTLLSRALGRVYSRRATLVLALAVAAGIGLSGARADAAPFDPRGEDWEGLAQLVRTAERELGKAHVAVTSSLPLQHLRREDGVIVIHPERVLDADELSAFMRAGGRLILFDDYGTGDEFLEHFGVRRVPLPAQPSQMLRGNPSLAIAEPTGAHPTVRDVAHVVTNHGTGLEHHALSPLLLIHGDGEPDVVLAIAGAVGRGRLIAVGDASIPINRMMRYPGNRALARSLVRYATEDDVWGKRGGTLYILTNTFDMTGTFGDDSLAGSATGVARRAVIDGLETLRHPGMPPRMAYFAALAMGIGLVAWTIARVGRTHKAVSPRFTRPVAVAAQGGIAGHAAVLGAPGTSRVLAMLELKSALEEQMATRLGLDRAPPRDVLVAKAVAEGLLDDHQAASLSGLLGELEHVEASFARLGRHPRPAMRIRDAHVLAVAARVRTLLGHVQSQSAHEWAARDSVQRAP
jgi:hypothetical protein